MPRVNKTTLIWGGAVLLLIVVGLWWYQQRPERVVNEALANLAAAQTEQFQATATVANNAATKKLLGEQGQVQLDLSGAFKKQATAAALRSTVAVTIKTDTLSVQLAGEARFIGDTAYLMITKVPNAVFPALE